MAQRQNVLSYAGPDTGGPTVHRPRFATVARVAARVTIGLPVVDFVVLKIWPSAPFPVSDWSYLVVIMAPLMYIVCTLAVSMHAVRLLKRLPLHVAIYGLHTLLVGGVVMLTSLVVIPSDALGFAGAHLVLQELFAIVSLSIAVFLMRYAPGSIR
jgi:hypothetical protein